MDVSSTFQENGQPNPTKDKDLQLSFILQQQFCAFKSKTQRRCNRRPSLPASSPKLPSNNFWSNSAQSCNSQSLPSSLPCVHVSMSKSHNRKNNKRKSFAFGTFASFKMVDSSTTTTHHSNMPIASTSPPKCKRKTRGTTQQPKWHPAMSCCAQSAQQPQSSVKSKPTQDLPTTPPSPPYGGVAALTTSRQSRSQMCYKMPMFLGGCPVFLIMMISCWSSNAFLRYIIQKQVEEFNHNVSREMLTHMFHRHIPNYLFQTVFHLNPRQCNHLDNAKTRRHVGGDMARQARWPAFSQFH